jgi:Leucine-rich repeat (LRR) protein
MSNLMKRLLGFLMCLPFAALVGCDALNSLGQEEEEPAEVVDSELSRPPEVGTPVAGEESGNGAPTSPEPTPPPTPEEVLGAFLAKSPRERTDIDLEQLAESPAVLTGITELDLRGGSISDYGLRYLGSFPDLERLDLSETRITSQGLSQLNDCEHLTSLALDHNRNIDETGIREITGLGLQEINLSSTSITDGVFNIVAEYEDLQVLRIDGNALLTGGPLRSLSEQFSGLRILSASGTAIGYGLQEVGRLNNLEELYVGHAEVTDDILMQLQQCRKLVEIDLSGNLITVVGVRQLAGLRNLQRLNLRECNAITDEALAALSRMNQLQRVDVTATQCTPSGVAAFKERLEETVIVFNDEAL